MLRDGDFYGAHAFGSPHRWQGEIILGEYYRFTKSRFKIRKITEEEKY